MPSSLKFGVDQGIVHNDLKLAAIGRNQGNALNLWLDAVEYFVCQAHGPISVVSDLAIDDGDF